MDETETFDEISIVTMCFNMGMEALSSVKGDKRCNYYEYYIKSVINMCRQFRNVIVFCDKECSSYLLHEIGDLNFFIIEMEFNKLEKMMYYEQYKNTYLVMKKRLLDKEKMSLRKKYTYSPIVKKEASAESIAKYTVLNHSKTDLMYKASLVNPFNTNYFYWLDGGCLQTKYEMFWKQWDGKIMHQPEGIRCALHMKTWSKYRKSTWRRKEIAYGFCEDQMAAVFWGGGQN